jgi:hypothetical protein
MPGLAGRITATLAAYKLPLLLGAGGLAAYSAYSSTQRQRAAAAAAATINAGAPLTPEQAAALLTQGAGLAAAAQAPIVGLAQGGLDVAATLGTGAQSLAALAVGNVGGAVTAIGDLAGQAIAVLPSFAPSAGIQPQPTSPPAPAKTVVSRTFIGYEARVQGPVTIQLYKVSNGRVVDRRNVAVSGWASYAVERRSGTEVGIYWRRSDGWSFVPARWSGFVIQKGFRVKYSDGTTATDWVRIALTAS